MFGRKKHPPNVKAAPSEVVICVYTEDDLDMMGEVFIDLHTAKETLWAKLLKNAIYDTPTDYIADDKCVFRVVPLRQ